MKNKVLILENNNFLDDDILKYVNTIDKEKNDVVFLYSLSNMDSKEIQKYVFETDEIIFKSIFFQRDQMEKLIDLICECAKKKETKYKVSVMFGQNNKFLDFLNISLEDVQLKIKIINSLIRINLHEILTKEVDENGDKSYFKTSNYKFHTEPVLFFNPFLKFIHGWNIHDKYKTSYTIEHGIVDIKKKENWLETLSTKEKKVLARIFTEYKAKLDYDLEDEDSIKKYFSEEESKKLIKEKKEELKLLKKLV